MLEIGVESRVRTAHVDRMTILAFHSFAFLSPTVPRFTALEGHTRPLAPFFFPLKVLT